MSGLEHTPTPSNDTPRFESWALVELMGRQRIVGRCSEEAHFGTALLRVDVPAQGSEAAYTSFYGGSAIYRITPVTEAVAQRLLQNVRPDPVPAWDLRAPAALTAPGETSYNRFSDADDFDDEEGDDASDE